MINRFRSAVAALALMGVGQAAMGAVVHAGAPVAVPVDAPWAMAGLVGVITVVVFRFLQARKK